MSVGNRWLLLAGSITCKSLWHDIDIGSLGLQFASCNCNSSCLGASLSSPEDRTRQRASDRWTPRQLKIIMIRRLYCKAGKTSPVLYLEFSHSTPATTTTDPFVYLLSRIYSWQKRKRIHSIWTNEWQCLYIYIFKSIYITLSICLSVRLHETTPTHTNLISKFSFALILSGKIVPRSWLVLSSLAFARF